MKKITAEEVIRGAKKQKIPFYRVKLVKERSIGLSSVENITDYHALVRVARMELADLPHEELIAIGLDGTNRPIGVVRVAQGGINSTSAAASDMDDIRMTDAIQRAAGCVGLALLDHVVIGSVRGGSQHRSILRG